MTNRIGFPLEYVVNANSIVKVNHTVKCEITLLLNDKQDEIPSRIFHECQFYSQSESYYYMRNHIATEWKTGRGSLSNLS